MSGSSVKLLKDRSPEPLKAACFVLAWIDVYLLASLVLGGVSDIRWSGTAGGVAGGFICYFLLESASAVSAIWDRS